MPVLHGGEQSLPSRLQRPAAGEREAARARASFARAADAQVAPYVARELASATAAVQESEVCARRQVAWAEEARQRAVEYATVEAAEAASIAKRCEASAEIKQERAFEEESRAVEHSREEMRAVELVYAEKDARRQHHLEELEQMLELKRKLVEMAVQTHHSLEARLVALEAGLTHKDLQIEALAWQHSAACQVQAELHEQVERLTSEGNKLRADLEDKISENGMMTEQNKLLNDAIMDHAREREGLVAAKRFEEDNRLLRAALLERADENDRLRQQIRMLQGFGSGASRAPVVLTSARMTESSRDNAEGSVSPKRVKSPVLA